MVEKNDVGKTIEILETLQGLRQVWLDQIRVLLREDRA